MNEAFEYVSELLAQMIFDAAKETEGREEFKQLIQSYLIRTSGIEYCVIRTFGVELDDERVLNFAKLANDLLFVVLIPSRMTFMFQHEPLTGTTRLTYTYRGCKESLVVFFHEKENLS